VDYIKRYTGAPSNVDVEALKGGRERGREVGKGLAILER